MMAHNHTSPQGSERVRARFMSQRENEPDPKSEMARQIKILRWVVIAMGLIGFRLYYGAHEDSAVRNGNKYACWSDSCVKRIDNPFLYK